MTKTFNWKIVLKTLGALLVIETLFLAMPAALSYWEREPELGSWLVTLVLTLVTGIVFLGYGRRAPHRVGEREGYMIVSLVWVVFSAFGMLPFYLSGALPTLADCWFESMAGFTTTGATVCDDVESMAHSLLLWRALMQWIGGLGIIVLSVAILPMFGLGGAQLYSAEAPGMSIEKLTPRIADTAKHMWVLYILLTASQYGLMRIFGMDAFDSICHTLATISTGGFSTRNDSIISYGANIQWTIAVFMFLSGMNFTQLIYLMRGKPRKILHDEETRWYVSAMAICTLTLAVGLFIHYGWKEPITGEIKSMPQLLALAERALRKSFFMISSAMTTTGFAASNYWNWPHLFWVLVAFVMLTGASSGSTSGGIKWVRLGIFAKSSTVEIKRRIHPNAVIPVRFNGQAVPHSAKDHVMAFLFFYIVIIIATTLVLCTTGIEFGESLGSAISAIGNVGVTIGDFGPRGGSFDHFSAVAKWTMTAVMLIGRLEIFTILILFTKTLWKK